ncbi:MAG: radical SAM protein [Candidatus Omnitrophota bacterium]|nr:radical SAM protein [Candidatus Omnitrophota bacterium]
MKILLISPPSVRIQGNISGVYPLPNLGLAYIAATLEKNNFDVKILDIPALRIQIKDLPGFLDGYTVYGISCNIFNLNSGIEIAGIIKDRNPLSKVVIGGRCTAFPSETLLKKFSNVDFLIRGEGEEAMLDLCRALKENSQINFIKGVSYRNGGSIIENPPGDPIDLDKLPFPARHLLPNKRYRMHPPFGIYPPTTIIETSRGCGYGCIFCSLPREVRERSVDRVIEDIQDVVEKLGIKEVHFIDPNFTYNQNRIIELCNRIIKKNIRIHWSCKTRVDLVSEELLKVMAKAGCYMISFGLESGSQKILDILNKKIKIQDTENAFKLCKKANIRTLAYTLLGSPGETRDTIEQTLRLVEKVDPDFVLYGELLPDPSSPLVKKAIEEKVMDFDKLIDFYVDNKNNHSLFDKNNIYNVSTEDIGSFIRYANARFYLRVRYIFKRLLLLRNVNEIIIMIKGVIFLLRDKIKKSYTVS